MCILIRNTLKKGKNEIKMVIFIKIMPEKIFSLNFKTSMAPIDPKVKKNEQTWNILIGCSIFKDFQTVFYASLTYLLPSERL